MTRPQRRETACILDDLGFAFLLSSIAYVALQLVLAGERRLFSVEKELSLAREIQTSILRRAFLAHPTGEVRGR